MIIVTLAAADTAFAGKIIDFIRNYDLNDYALGFSVSAQQNPYAGGENSTIAYPILTSFRDSAFTKDWLLLREGDIGVRWVSENDWELGVVGRIQTLGFGSSKSPLLTGLNDRQWGLEMAPIVGYRGWPVHINFKAYTEIFGLHGGWLGELEFSLPREFKRGYLVPSVGVIQQTADYTNYYFGVAPGESNIFRPAYQTDGALNTAVKVRWGYALTEKWLLSGSVGLEFLDSAITSSPIVDQDQLFSASISLAYNNDVFQPRISSHPPPGLPRFEFRFGAFLDSIDSSVVRDPSSGGIGSDIDIEDLLGLSDQETVLNFDAIYRISRFHRLELGYLTTSRGGQITLQRDLEFGDNLFPAGTKVDSNIDTEILRVGYAYSLMNDPQKELGIMGGVHFSKFAAEIKTAATGKSAVTSANTPLPVIGLHGSVALGQRSTLGARLQFFRMDFDRYEGSLNYASLDWRLHLGDTLSVGLAYNYYALKLESSENDVNGSLQVRHFGPEVYIGMAF